MNKIKIGGKKSVDQRNIIRNVTIFFDLREKIIDFFKDYSLLLSEAKYKTKYGERLKMLTPKKMRQRLSIALVQVKAGNNSENLLNEIRKTVYLLYQSKEIIKKVYNNIVKSIQI